MTKICTTIEQSKKLLELGIDENTADMYYLYDRNLHKMYGDFPYCREYKRFDGGVDVPAWSLSALLDLLPNEIDGLWTKLVKTEDEYFVEGGHSTFNNPVDACYEMILKLHELKLL